MDILALAKAISEVGIYVIIATFFLFLVYKLQKQDEKNDAKLEEAHKYIREQSANFLKETKESRDKYLQSMQEITGKITTFEVKLDNVSNEMRELKKEVRRGEK